MYTCSVEEKVIKTKTVKDVYNKSEEIVLEIISNAGYEVVEFRPIKQEDALIWGCDNDIWSGSSFSFFKEERPIRFILKKKEVVKPKKYRVYMCQIEYDFGEKRKYVKRYLSNSYPEFVSFTKDENCAKIFDEVPEAFKGTHQAIMNKNYQDTPTNYIHVEDV